MIGIAADFFISTVNIDRYYWFLIASVFALKRTVAAVAFLKLAFFRDRRRGSRFCLHARRSRRDGDCALLSNQANSSEVLAFTI